MIHTLFPESVVTVAATAGMYEAPLLADETPYAHRMVEKRKREFRAGRACAREALARLGMPGRPLVPGSNRAPVWPPGIVGSIAHCEGYCGVAVARRGDLAGLGLDVEVAGSLPQDIVRLVCSGTELASVAFLEAPSPSDWPKLIFSAKESVYKCWHPLTSLDLEFLDVEVRFEPASGTFTARLLDPGTWPPWIGSPLVTGRYHHDARFVFTGAVIPVCRQASSGSH